MPVTSVSAVTFAVRDVAASIEFYQSCGFSVVYGGPDAPFTSLRSGDAFVNLIRTPDYRGSWWGRAIFRVDDADALYRVLVSAGRHPHAPPADAAWGERYFHITDPDGHEISFAQNIANRPAS